MYLTESHLSASCLKIYMSIACEEMIVKPSYMISLGALFLLILGGIVWLATAPIHPPEQTVNQVLSDDRISH